MEITNSTGENVPLWVLRIKQWVNNRDLVYTTYVIAPVGSDSPFNKDTISKSMNHWTIWANHVLWKLKTNINEAVQVLILQLGPLTLSSTNLHCCQIEQRHF